MKVGFISLGCSKNLIDTEVAIGHFKNNKFEIVNNPEEAEKLKNAYLEIDREDAIPLEEGEVYLADIMNSKVVTEDGEEFGELVDILETGANLVFVVKHDGKEVLLQDIPDCVKEVDDENKIITVHIMKGLLDL